ncbi:MAG TPA: pitrilysin family protein [Methylococcaceae bacterium]|nr:pitrilysin family protein [Methylococcaceae bacterium]
MNKHTDNDTLKAIEKTLRELQTDRAYRLASTERRGPDFWFIWTVIELAMLLTWAAGVWAANREEGQGTSVIRANLENGLRVVIVRNTLAPVVTTAVNYRVGSNEAPEGFPGMAHAQEHMMFRGSPGLSADQMAEITAAMGGMFNADTQQSVTQYFLTVPAEDLDVALRIEAIRMRGVLDTEELWEQERGAIEQEVSQDLSNPEYVFYTKLLEALFKDTPYAHDALGSRPSFDKTTGTMLKNFHDTWYVPNNAILVIVGDVQPPKALSEVRKLFGSIPSRKLPKRPGVHLKPVTPETIQLDTDLPYGLAVLSFRLSGSDSPDFAPTQILSDILSSQRGSLYALVPEGKALSVDFSLDVLPEAGLGYVEAAFPKGGDGPALIDEVKKILAEDVKNGISPDLVEAAKRHELADAEFEKNSVSGLAMVWSQALAIEGRRSPEEDVKAMESVTVSDVNRAARKYLDLNHAIVAVLTPQSSGEPIAGKGFGGRESFAPKEVRPVKLPGWAEKAVNRISVPDSTIHPAVIALSNGLQLIVQTEAVSNTVAVYGHIKNNPYLETPEGQEGVDEVLDKLFSYGTASLDRVSFQKALDDIGANESAGEDFFLQVMADRFDRGVELLADNELHPALPEAAFKIIQRQDAAAIAGRLQSPDYLTSRSLRAALFPKDDPTLRQANPETISSLTLENVLDYYRHIYRPDLTTIVVVGEVTPEKAREVIEKYFGSWNASGPRPETLLPPVPPNKPSIATVPDASKVQDSVTLAETLGLNRSNPDYYALELGNHVLGGAFYATRLYRDLREGTGLVYFVSSSFEVNQTRALYVVNYGCDPSNGSRARDIVLRNLKEMQTTPVSLDELNQAKALLLREIPLSESSLERIGAGLLSRATHDLPLDEPTRAARRYDDLTAQQVEAAFAKWVRPEDLIQVTEGPNAR